MDGWRKIFEACAFSLESTENVPNGLRSTIIFRPENKKIFFFRGTNVCSVRKKGLFRTEKVGNISFPWNKFFFRRPRMKNSKAEPAELPLRSGNSPVKISESDFWHFLARKKRKSRGKNQKKSTN